MRLRLRLPLNLMPWPRGLPSVLYLFQTQPPRSQRAGHRQCKGKKVPRPYSVGRSGGALFLSSFRDHHGTNDRSVSHQVSIGYSRSLFSAKCFSWSLQPDLKAPLTGCCSWQTDRKGRQNTPFGQNARSQDKQF